MLHPSLRSERGSTRLGLLLVTVAALTASVMVAAGIWMLRRPNEPRIADFQVVPVHGGGPAGLGSAYRIEFELRRAGYPLVLHLDGDGMPSLLFPERNWIPVGRGYAVALPDAEGGAAWWLSGETGRGCFLLAVGDDESEGPDELVAEVERVAARARTPEDARRRVREYLRLHVGEVREIPGDRRDG